MASQTKMWDPEFVLGVSLRKPTCLGYDYVTHRPCGLALSPKSASNQKRCLDKLSESSPLRAASSPLLVPAAGSGVCDLHWREAMGITEAWKHRLQEFSCFETWCDEETEKAVEAAELMKENEEEEEDDNYDDADDEMDDLAESVHGDARSDVYSPDKSLASQIDALRTGKKSLDLLVDVISAITDGASDLIAQMRASLPGPRGPDRTPTVIPPDYSDHPDDGAHNDGVDDAVFDGDDWVKIDSYHSF